MRNLSPMTHADLIEAKGAAEIAAAMGVDLGHVRVWKNRGIPRSRYAFLLDAFPDLTLAMLRDGEPETKAA